MKYFFRCSALVIAFVFAFSGCASQEAVPPTTVEIVQETEPIPSSRQLALSVRPDESSFLVLPPDDLGDNFQFNLYYQRVKEVTITIEEENIPLEDALSKGKVSEEDIFYLARKDARNGFCEMDAVSLRGVTNFYFHYPDYSLKLIYDIQETPDGDQHLISELVIYLQEISGEDQIYELGPSTHFLDPETGEYLDEEEWGLTFELQQCSATEATVVCTQSGGQQIGDLFIKYYYLSNASDGIFLSKMSGTEGAEFEAIPITMDGTTTFTIDWEEWYGELPRGVYNLQFDVYDLFDPKEVPPLTVDFHSRQMYSVNLTVPD